MRVYINANIFHHLTNKLRQELHYMLTIASFRNRHSLYFDGLMTDSIKCNLDAIDAEILLQASIDAVNGYVADCEISEDGCLTDDKKVFTVSEGCLFLNDPFRVILENDNNDAKFIDALIDCFSSNMLSEAKMYKWMEYDNAGGCSNVRNKIGSLLRQNEGRIKFLHCFVILDSDKYAPDHINKNSQANILYLTEHGIPFHMLEKRAMENYMPDDALPDGVWKRAYTYLSELQKDHYNMADGFRKDEKFRQSCEMVPKNVIGRDRLLDCQKRLFADLSDTNYGILYNGLPMKNFKDTFPSLFDNRDNVNYDTLIERTKTQNNPNELREIIVELEQNL